MAAARGFDQYAEKRRDETLASFDEAIKADPKNAENYRGRGKALQAQGKLEAAEDYYCAAARLAA